MTFSSYSPTCIQLLARMTIYDSTKDFAKLLCTPSLFVQTLARCDVFIRRKCRALPMMTQGGQERRAWWCPEKWSVHQSSVRDAYKVVDDVDIFLVCYCQYCVCFWAISVFYSSRRCHAQADRQASSAPLRSHFFWALCWFGCFFNVVAKAAQFAV